MILHDLVKLMEEDCNSYADIGKEPNDGVGSCGLNATLIREYVRYVIEKNVNFQKFQLIGNFDILSGQRSAT